jgi:hypothetical protein
MEPVVEETRAHGDEEIVGVGRYGACR